MGCDVCNPRDSTKDDLGILCATHKVPWEYSPISDYLASDY
jgi:hypothetical protein